MKYATFLSVFLFVPSCLGSGETVPSIKLCKPTEPKLAECWIGSIAQITLSLMNGIPSMNFPSIQRLYIPSYKINARTASIDLANLVFEGVHNFDIIDMTTYPDTNTLYFRVLVSELSLESDVISRGRYADFSIEGNGKITVIIKNLVIDHQLEAQIFTENDFTYRYVDGYATGLDYDSVEIQQQDVIRDPEVIAALKERIQDKTSAFNEQFLELLRNTFVKRLSQYAVRAYNQYPMAIE